MPIRARKNQYRGVNAHLHSYFQAESGWKGFHTAHITTLWFTLNTLLIPKGYEAEIESSLQIRQANLPPKTPIADISIYERDATQQEYARPLPVGAAAGVVYALEDTVEILDDVHDYKAIAVYGLENDAPVAWLELLSPSNKVGSSAERYLQKRKLLLENGIVFVEIDYLHETQVTITNLPIYPGDDNGQPYHMLVFEPRPAPDYPHGRTYVYGFNVDDPLPVLTLPLTGDDYLNFDLNPAYARVFSEGMYGLRRVDYAQLPHNFQRYSHPDQGRIAARMLAIKQAVERGDDLEDGPFDLPDVTLQAALDQLGIAQE